MSSELNGCEFQLTVSWATEMYAIPLNARGSAIASKVVEAMSVSKVGGGPSKSLQLTLLKV